MKHAIVLFTVMVITAVCSFSQNETGVRYIDSVQFASRKWLKLDSTVKYRKAFPIIRNVPPLSGSNPWQINLAYIVVDSVLRTYDFTTLDTLLANTSTGSDTPCVLYKYMYEIKNFDSRTVAQYDIETRLEHREHLVTLSEFDTTATVVGRYRSNLVSLEQGLLRRYALDHATDSSLNASLSLLVADVIVRVEVTSVDSTPRETNVELNPFLQGNYYKVTAKLLYSYKGGLTLATSPSDSSAPITTPTNQFFSFDYSSKTYPPISDLIPGSASPILDSNLIDSERRLDIRPGDHLIVFLTYQSPLLDATHDYLRLSICRDASLGVLLVDSTGHVRDLNQLWNIGYFPSIATWENRINFLINRLISCE